MQRTRILQKNNTNLVNKNKVDAKQPQRQRSHSLPLPFVHSSSGHWVPMQRQRAYSFTAGRSHFFNQHKHVPKQLSAEEINRLLKKLAKRGL